MLLLGLTGSIATGKSTVSQFLQSEPHNLPIIDADVLARKVVEPGTSGYAAIVKYFSASTPDLLLPPEDPLCQGHENGRDGKGRPINRPALGRAIFGNGTDKVKARHVLNGIVHPAVRREMWKQVARYYLTGHQAVVLDIPLLFEGPLHYFCGTTIVVAVTDPKIQMERLRQRDSHLTEEDAMNRVLSQGDVREKAQRALFRGNARGKVLWNDSDRDALKRDIDKLMDQIKSDSPYWWSLLCLLCPPVAITSASWSLLYNWYTDRRWQKQEQVNKARL